MTNAITVPACTGDLEPLGAMQLRYEDVTQDGRVQIVPLVGSSSLVWKLFSSRPEVHALMAKGIYPILRRIVVEGEPGPFSAQVPLALRGAWRLFRESGGDRILLSFWVEAHAPNGTTRLPAPAADAARVLVGRVYAEHVMTKPFGPLSDRKVVDLPGFPLGDAAPVLAEPLPLLQDLPLAPAGAHLFSLMHTDGNQHVNSLVYPRLFEEHAHSHGGVAADRLARACEICYRKPFFVGDRAQIALRHEGDTVVGSFAPPGADKPSTTLAMRFG